MIIVSMAGQKSTNQHSTILYVSMVSRLDSKLLILHMTVLSDMALNCFWASDECKVKMVAKFDKTRLRCSVTQEPGEG